eukprot:CFRG6131T1
MPMVSSIPRKGNSLSPASLPGGPLASARLPPTGHTLSAVFPKDDNKSGNTVVIMSMYWKKNILGVACYSEDLCTLSILLDVLEDAPSFNMMRKAPNSKIEIVPEKQFKYETCKRKLLDIPLPSIPAEFSDHQRELYISGFVNMDNQMMVRCVGCLLAHIEEHRIGVDLEDSSVPVPILGLEVIKTENLLIMDEDVFSSLQIFRREQHPAGLQQKRSKEGLSLFGILNRTRSALGAQKLRKWFLSPSRDIEIVTHRLDTIQYLLQPNNVELFGLLNKCMKDMKNLPRILAKMCKTFQTSTKEWNAIRMIAAFDHKELEQVVNVIDNTVDFHSSAAIRRTIIQPNINKDLDSLKQKFEGLPDLLTRVAAAEMETYQDIPECTVVYFPQLGYLLAIPRNPPTSSTHQATNTTLNTCQKSTTTDLQSSARACTQIPTISTQLSTDWTQLDNIYPDLVFQFCTPNAVHYKSVRMNDLDALLGDIHGEIMDIETQICNLLQQNVLEKAPILLRMSELASELDCLLSLATAARDCDFSCRPQLTYDSIIHIVGGRHPLQELCTDEFISNDTQMTPSEGIMQIITGANASGKSVYMKQVGLLAYLAHLGSFLPALSARIGFCDRIFISIS